MTGRKALLLKGGEVRLLRGKTVASCCRDCLRDRQRKGARSTDDTVTAEESLKIAKTRARGSVQAGRTETSESDHERVAHASQEGHRVAAAACAATAGENTRGGERDWIGFRLRRAEGHHGQEQSTHDRCFEDVCHL